MNISSDTFVRGDGTSLVYYAIRHAGVTQGMAPLGETEVAINQWLSIVAGGSYHTFAYKIEHGYDRYNSFQTLNEVPFATVQIYHPYLGVRLGGRFNLDGDDAAAKTEGMGFYFTVGPTLLQPIHFAPAAQGTKTTGGMHGISFGMGYYFNHAFFQRGRARAK